MMRLRVLLCVLCLLCGVTARAELAIHITDPASANAVRAAVINDVWSGNGYPSTGVDSIATYVDSSSLITGLTNYRRADRYSVTTNGDTVQPWLLHPIRSNRQLLIVGLGHSNSAISGLDSLIRAGLAHGNHVLVIPMPSGNTSGHDALGEDDDPGTFSAMEYWLTPAAKALNQAVTDLAPTKIVASGLSGGGWLTVMISALDERISMSLSVAGTMPLDLRVASDISDYGDWEQRLNNLTYDGTNQLDYLDLYVLATTSGRKQIMVGNDEDPSNGYDVSDDYPGGRYVEFVGMTASAATTIGGTWICEVVDNDQHTILPSVIETYLHPELGSLPTLPVATNAMRGYRYWRPIALTTNETDYVVRVDLDSDNFDFSLVKTHGEDIAFVQGSLKLRHFIAHWDSVAQEARVYVRVPECSSQLRMYYSGPDNPSDPRGVSIMGGEDIEDGTIGSAPLRWNLVGTQSDNNHVRVANDFVRPTLGPTVLAHDVIRTQTGSNPTTAERVPHQRSNFYAHGLWWRAYSLLDSSPPHDIVIESSPDGVTWSAVHTITDGCPVADAQWAIVYSPVTNKCGYVRNIQSGTPFHDGLAFRQGTPNPDGTITWDAAEQTVIATGNFVGDFCPLYDDTGHLWVAYGNDGTANPSVQGDAIVIKNANLDGTWANASGFPVTVHEGIGNDSFGVLAPLGGGAMHTAVYEWNSDIPAWGYVIEADGTLTPEGLMTELEVEANSGSGAKVGRIESVGVAGEVWYAYQAANQTIRVGRRRINGTLEPEVEIAGSRYVTDTIASPRLTILPDGLACMWTGQQPTNATLPEQAIYISTYSHADGIWTAPTLLHVADVDNVYEHLMPSEHAAPDGTFLAGYLTDDNESCTILCQSRPAMSAGKSLRFKMTNQSGEYRASRLWGWGIGYRVEIDFRVDTLSVGGDTMDFACLTLMSSNQNNKGASVNIYGHAASLGGDGSVGYNDGGVHQKLEPISFSRWHTLGLQYTAAGSYDIYLDDEPVATGVTPVSSGQYARLGIYHFNPHTGTIYWDNLRTRRIADTEPVATVGGRRINRDLFLGAGSTQ